MQHPSAKNSYYRASCLPLPAQAQQQGSEHASVLIIGSGFTGLSSALHLALRGYRVVVLEAREIAFGASSRNGGQVSSGQRIGMDSILHHYGKEHAHQLWNMAEDAKNLVKNLIKKYEIDCGLKPGVIEAAHKPRYLREFEEYAAFMEREFHYPHLKFVKGQDFQAYVQSPDLYGGLADYDAAQLHPLAFARGIYLAAIQAGAVFYENSPVLTVEQNQKVVAKTPKGEITADCVIYACNGYLDDLDRSTAKKLFSINNFIIATEPLEDELVQKTMPADFAVADTRQIINYFRLSSDNRLLFGGGETYSFDFPQDIQSYVRPHMLNTFPQLNHVKIDYGWGGTLALTRPRLPVFQKVGKLGFAACGYSGHGISIGTMAGLILADAVDGQMSRFDIMEKIRPKSFPGGPWLRRPLLLLAMFYARIRDRL